MDDLAFLNDLRAWFTRRTDAWLTEDCDPRGGSGAEYARRRALMSKRGAVDEYVLCRVQLLGTCGRGEETVQRAREHLLFLYEQAGQMATEERALDHVVFASSDKPVVLCGDNLTRTPSARPMADFASQSQVERMYRRDGAGFEPRRGVRYAQRWWNSRNPDYPQFENDCANFVSQALFAAGHPMTFSDDRATGWWFRRDPQTDWSFSWSVAHALVAYLRLTAEGECPAAVREHAQDLDEGDVIAYDWSGDGRYDHVALVTGRDAVGEPLVHAHTVDSADRHWSYEDSASWTPATGYLFLHLG
ncbi:MAG: amidase domain-containing protein [Firmicutes bacterium]|nr:amidase domain-containing protein [Bacillota bacterium]